MISYAVKERVFKPGELLNYGAAARIIERLDEPEGKTFRCHELARAMSRVLGLPYQDGYYEHIQHTWLWTCELPEPPFGYREVVPNILDIYVPGGHPQVQLVDFSSILPARRTYIWTVPLKVEDIDEELVDALEKLFKEAI